MSSRSSRMTLVLLLAGTFLTGCATTGGQRGEGSERAARDAKLAQLPAEELVRLGEEHSAKGNHSLAKLHFALAAEKAPESVPALVGLGEYALRERRDAEAASLFQRALDREPSSPDALFGLGRAEVRLGNAERAAEALKQAASLAPERADVLEELALAYESQGKLELALPLFQLAAEKAGTARAYNDLGYNYLLQWRYEDAIPPLEQAVELDPANERARNNLALAYAMTGRDADAFRLFESTVGRAAAYNNLGYLQMMQGEWQEAESNLRSAMEVSPTYYVRARGNLDRLGQHIYARVKEDLESLEDKDGSAANE